MKFDKFTYITDWEWFFIFPCIVTIKDEAYLCCKNFTIGFHFLGWHFRWRWLEREDKR